MKGKLAVLFVFVVLLPMILPMPLSAHTTDIDFYGAFEQHGTILNTLAPEDTKKEMQAAIDGKRNHFIFKHRLAGGEIRTVELYSYSIFRQTI